MANEIVEALEKLAKDLQPLAESAWAIMVKQSYVTGWQLLVGAIVGLAAAIIGAVISKKIIDDNDCAVGFILMSIFGAVCFIICIIIAIGYFFNPEYYAIRSLMH